MEIRYKTEHPQKEKLYELYEKLGWNEYLKLEENDIYKAMEGSYYSVYAYIDESLIGTGRIVSDGVMSAFLCGLGVLKEFRNNGIGKTIMKMLIEKCEKENIHAELFCEPHLKKYYEDLGFTEFAVGMKRK